MLRLLGNCPSCHAEDRIVENRSLNSKYGRVFCQDCLTYWDDYGSFVREHDPLDKRLIPLNVWRRDYSVELFHPGKNEVPHADLVVGVLNSALIEKFDLSVCLACEGGVVQRGKGWRKYYELRNCYDTVGLFFEEGNPRVAQGALNLYEKMLRQLVEQPLTFAGKTYRAGEILRLEHTAETQSDALIYLFGTLTKVVHRDFALNVFQRKKDVESNPFSAPGLRGLSNDDIVRLFVPPPFLSND